MDIIEVLRLIPFLLLPALASCTTAASTPPEMRFALAEPGKYKSEVEKERAQQMTQNDCKSKAMATSAALEKTIASERNSMENISRAREKSAEMYATSFTLCMNNAGYVQK